MSSHSNYNNVYVLTFELYYDNVRYTTRKDGHFFNVLVRYYNENSNISVNARTAATGRIISKIISARLNVFDKQIGLVRYEIEDLYKFDIIMPKFKNMKIHYSTHMSGTIYDIMYDNIIDMLNSVKYAFNTDVDELGKDDLNIVNNL